MLPTSFAKRWNTREKTMIDWTKPIRQKNGRGAVCHATDGKDPKPIIIEWECSHGGWAASGWGHEAAEAYFENIPERVVRYVPAYLGRGYDTLQGYDTLDKCKRFNPPEEGFSYVRRVFDGPKLISAEVVE